MECRASEPSPLMIPDDEEEEKVDVIVDMSIVSSSNKSQTSTSPVTQGSGHLFSVFFAINVMALCLHSSKRVASISIMFLCGVIFFCGACISSP